MLDWPQKLLLTTTAAIAALTTTPTISGIRVPQPKTPAMLAFVALPFSAIDLEKKMGGIYQNWQY